MVDDLTHVGVAITVAVAGHLYDVCSLFLLLMVLRGADGAISIQRASAISSDRLSICIPSHPCRVGGEHYWTCRSLVHILLPPWLPCLWQDGTGTVQQDDKRHDAARHVIIYYALRLPLNAVKRTW